MARARRRMPPIAASITRYGRVTASVRAQAGPVLDRRERDASLYEAARKLTQPAHAPGELRELDGARLEFAEGAAGRRNDRVRDGLAREEARQRSLGAERRSANLEEAGVRLLAVAAVARVERELVARIV